MIEVLNSAINEVLWPTRCAICDKPGEIICEECLRKLPYIDINKSCKICGEPYGFCQCCGIHSNIKQTISATLLNKDSGHIISIYKDAGELRLARLIANIMYSYMPRNWIFDSLTYIPSSKNAYNKRGYDHAKILAETFSEISGKPVIEIFDRPTTLDQRKLTKSERSQNIKIKVKNSPPCNSILLIDDVYTTGATLNACASQLKVNNIYALTFTRTF